MLGVLLRQQFAIVDFFHKSWFHYTTPVLVFDYSNELFYSFVRISYCQTHIYCTAYLFECCGKWVNLLPLVSLFFILKLQVDRQVKRLLQLNVEYLIYKNFCFLTGIASTLSGSSISNWLIRFFLSRRRFIISGRSLILALVDWIFDHRCSMTRIKLVEACTKILILIIFVLVFVAR